MKISFDISSKTFFSISWYNERPWKLEWRYVNKSYWTLIIGKLWFDLDTLPF